MKFRSLVMAIVLIAVASLTPVAHAEEKEYESTVSYSVAGYQVCQYQGHFAATTLTPWNPYSMLCYDLSVPAGITIAGSLDIQGFCSAKYPGSQAVLVEENILGWRCERREKVKV